MNFRSDSQRKAMFAAINGINSFSAIPKGNCHNKFTLYKDNNSGRIKSDEYPEVDFKLVSEFGNIKDKKDLIKKFPDEYYTGLENVSFRKVPLKLIDDKLFVDVSEDDLDYVTMKQGFRGRYVSSEDIYNRPTHDYEYHPHGDRIVVMPEYHILDSEDLDDLADFFEKGYKDTGDIKLLDKAKKYRKYDSVIENDIEDVDDVYAHELGHHIDTTRWNEYKNEEVMRDGKPVKYWYDPSENFADAFAIEYGFKYLSPHIGVYNYDNDFDKSLPSYKSITFDEAEEYIK